MPRFSYKNAIEVNVPVSTKERTITFQNKHGYTYVNVTVEKMYLRDKKYNQDKRECIGRLVSPLPDNWKDPESGLGWPSRMLANDHFSDIFTVEALFSGTTDKEEETVALKEDQTQSVALSIGPYVVIRKIADTYGLTQILEKSLNRKLDVNRILDLAAYMIVTEDNASLHFCDYAYKHVLFTRGAGISDETIGRTLRLIDQEVITSFLEKWNDVKIKEQEESELLLYFSGDSTNSPSDAGEIEYVEFGASKVDDGNAIINEVIAVSMDDKMPRYYELYPGSINDVSQIKYLVHFLLDYGYTRFGLIMDRGYFSRENIRYFDKNGISFLIMAKGYKEFARKKILKHINTFENDNDCYISRYNVYGTTFKDAVYEGDNRERYFHLFFNSNRVSAEQAKFRSLLTLWEKKLFKLRETKEVIDRRTMRKIEQYYKVDYDKNNRIVNYSPNKGEINNELKLAGYFVIISSEKMSAVEAITLYKSRDISEKLFVTNKSFLGNNTYRVHTTEALDGKAFIGFIALILRQGLYLALKRAEDKLGKQIQHFDVPAAIAALEKLEITSNTTRCNYHQRDPISKKQREILKACGISERAALEDIKSQCEVINQFNNNPKGRISEKIEG